MCIICIIDIICLIVRPTKIVSQCYNRAWHMYVPYHPEVLRAHQNHSCLLVRREGRGFQIDEHETQTETLQTCQAEQRECHKCPTCQHFHAWFCGNQGHRSPHAGPRRPPMCARCDDVPVMESRFMSIMCIIDIICIMKLNTYKYENITLVRSHIFNSIPLHGPSSSPAIKDSIPTFQKRSGANALPLLSVQFSAVASPSSTRHRTASHKSWDASLFKECVISVLAKEEPWFVRRPCWWTQVLCPPSGPSQQQLMGLA